VLGFVLGEREEFRLRMRDGFFGENVMDALEVFRRPFGMEKHLGLPLPRMLRFGAKRFVAPSSTSLLGFAGLTRVRVH
jgi:hypothetical protein